MFMQEARRQKICDILPSFGNSIISTYIIFYVTVGSEVKPGGYTKKTQIVVLFIYRKRKKPAPFNFP